MRHGHWRCALWVTAASLLACGDGAPTERSTRGDLRLRTSGTEGDALHQIDFGFGEVAVGASTRATLELVNVGPDNARVSAARFVDTPAGVFYVQAPTSVPAGETRPVVVTFSPREVGEVTGQLRFEHDGDALAPTVFLSGTGR